MRKKSEQPGFLVFYDLLRSFRKMKPEDVGRFVMAMGEYSQMGVVPDFRENQVLDFLWDQTFPNLDRNKDSYERNRLSRSYNGWCSSLEKSNRAYMKIPYEEYVIAMTSYDEYLTRAERAGHTPMLFTNWLEWTKRQEEQREAEQEDVPDFLKG